MRKFNIIYAITAICLGLFAALYSVQYGIGDSRMRIGAGFFPMAMACGLVLTGTIIFAGALRSPADGPCAVNMSGLARVGVFIAAFFCYFLLLKPLGFIADSILIIIFCMWQLGCRKWTEMLVYAIVLSSVVFCAFYYLMFVDLPLGILSSVLPKY